MVYEDYIDKTLTVVSTYITPTNKIQNIEKIVDKTGIIIGYLMCYYDGDIVARDKFFNYLGRYEKDKNITIDFYRREYKGVNLTKELIKIQ